MLRITGDISRFTTADALQPGRTTETFLRFSTVAGERGAADAERDVRGFALRMYTGQGNWDIVGNNTPVFFVRDPLKFPISSIPKSGIQRPICARPQRCGILVAVAGKPASGDHPDVGSRLPQSYRHIDGFGSHTYSFINAANQRFWVKFHFKTKQGIANWTNAEGANVIAADRESHQRDLFEAIEQGNYPK